MPFLVGSRAAWQKEEGNRGDDRKFYVLELSARALIRGGERGEKSNLQRKGASVSQSVHTPLHKTTLQYTLPDNGLCSTMQCNAEQWDMQDYAVQS